MRRLSVALLFLAMTHAATAPAAIAQSTLTGADAYGDWRADAPGVRRLIRPADLPAPVAPQGSSNPRVVAKPDGARLAAPPGFVVEPYATGLSGPRTLRFAPNGDLFVAESRGDRVSLLRRSAGDAPNPRRAIVADRLDGPFGLAFAPARNFLYVATATRILRYPYAGADAPLGAPETLFDKMPPGGHWTRDLLFSRDGATLYVSVGSLSNAATDMGRAPADLAAHERAHGRGAAWGDETGRASVLAFSPDARTRKPFATGLRNCVAMALAPASDDLWCVVNERDRMGDNLPPDYATRVAANGFYGWPWFYIGANVDPRHRNARPDLAAQVLVPDVLIQPHSAPLGIAFYEADAFPKEYRGSAFIALHGSWNRARRTGYKIVRALFENGRPTGAYEDFVTGFVASDSAVWGRPVSVAVGPDGALYFSDDAGDAIWRVRFVGK